MKSGQTQEAMTRFESIMKDAPDSAFLHYTRAFYMQSAGKYPEALQSANKALALAATDPLLLPQLQQNAGQMGQPTTIEGFKENLQELRRALEPRVRLMRERREKAVKERKKKSKMILVSSKQYAVSSLGGHLVREQGMTICRAASVMTREVNAL